jgi:hypothetical protein
MQPFLIDLFYWHRSIAGTFLCLFLSSLLELISLRIPWAMKFQEIGETLVMESRQENFPWERIRIQHKLMPPLLQQTSAS